ncbi:cyclic nucleotide-binding domain protein (macronuclear) [Tetrahymena thermophila SB210]|uniref:Cyclic nucleotide-binding domain protein n=1 Tax=Tetrahymena thermophila (strain SB210) TaxID=312017 RepID=Q23AJ6_TETTS|nr:cyclic nucleotide-binding domain protein [Tetrahymena thermophila SB210]EAR93496.1 cyclic nucleotide-binding domain protein [Tetrahymena thermophila SB210]|eukprot:XP_001013741.1 cyclic nucleotide-binding domain protein [Tetrahymena thermophila SB210]
MSKLLTPSIDQGNKESQNIIVEDLEHQHYGQTQKQPSWKDGKQIESLTNLQVVPLKKGDQEQFNSEGYNNEATSLNKICSEKRISQEKMINIDNTGIKQYQSNKGSMSDRGIDAWGEKLKKRQSKNYMYMPRQSDVSKDISTSMGEDQTIFAFSKGPNRYKMTKRESVFDKPNQEHLFMQKMRKRVMRFFQNYTNKGKLQFYEKLSVHRTINDKSDCYFDKKSQLPFSWIFNKLQKKLITIYSQSFISKIPVIRQQTYLSLILNFLVILYNFLFFLLLSIILVFPDVIPGSQTTLYKITLGIWIFEVLLKLNTSTHKDSNVITNRKQIVAIYFKKYIIWDSISFILLILLILGAYISQDLGDGWSVYILFQIICFVKLFNLQKDLEVFQQQLCTMVRRYYLIKLINLIVKFFIIGHMIALIWYLIGKFEQRYLGESVTWQNQGILQDPSWWRLYLMAMNWSLMMMTTSQSTGTTVLQIFFATFIMLFTTIIAGYMITVTGQILSEMDASEENKKTDLNIINDYMRNKKISSNLQLKVNVYLDYFYQKNYQKQQEDTKNVLSKISSELRSNLQKEYFYQILSKIDFLKYNYTAQSLQNIAIKCEEIAYFPNQTIFEENDYSNAALLIIIEGSVEIYSQVANSHEIKVITQLKEGNILGQINFFTGMARSASARSVGFTKIARITRDNFMEVVKDNEQDIQTFYQMKDNILLYENYREMNIKCSACQSFGHLQGSCSLVHFNKEFAIQSAKVSNQIQQRRGVNLNQRKVNKKHNTLKKLQETVEKNLQLLQTALQDSNFYTQTLENEEVEEDGDDLSSSSEAKLQNQNSLKSQQQLKKIPEQEDEEEDRNSNYQLINKNKNKENQEDNNTQLPFSSSSQSQAEQQDGNVNRRLLQNNQISQFNTQNERLEQIHKQSDLINLNKKTDKTDENQQQIKIQANQILPEEAINKKKQINKHFSPVYTQNAQKQTRLEMKMKLQEIKDIQEQENQSNSPDRSPQSQNGEEMLMFDQIKENYLQTQNTVYDELNSSYNNILNNSSTHGGKIDKNIRKYQSIMDTFYWSFDKQKNYDFYFNHGNAFIKIHQYKYYQKKKELKQFQAGALIKGMQSRRSKGSRGASFLVQKIQMLQNIGSLVNIKQLK